MLPPTADLSALAEQQCRIEHKLDLIILFLATQFGEFQLTPMAEGLDPLSLQPVTYLMDLMRGHVVRPSSYGTGLVPPASVLFNTTPTSNPTGNNNGGNQGESG